MACSPHYCNYHSTGTTTCSGHRPACGTNRVINWSDAVQGGPIYASQVEELRVAIINEAWRWKSHAWYAGNPVYDPGVVGAGGVVQANTFNLLNTDLAYIYGSITGVAGGGIIDDWNWDSLIAYYNAARQNCICNSDCSCNAVCACYGDCGCNYSDERLKTNIVFEGVKNGLNMYSWNYIWDATKRHVGVIAQELLGTEHEHALTTDAAGYYMVNYSKLPI